MPIALSRHHRRERVLPITPRLAAERAIEIANAARDVPLPAHARELVERLAGVIDDLAVLIDPPAPRAY